MRIFAAIRSTKLTFTNNLKYHYQASCKLAFHRILTKKNTVLGWRLVGVGGAVVLLLGPAAQLRVPQLLS
jgi:hypothetical protein